MKKPPKDYGIVNIPQNPNDEITGIRLINDGWRKPTNATYEKDGKIITYDGNHWFMDGKRVEKLKDIRY